MENRFVRHIVAEMDKSMVQRCLICGEMITDYRNVMVPSGQFVRGWPAGEVYVKKGNPQISQTMIGDDDFVICKSNKENLSYE